MAECNPQELVLENIVRIDETALSNNFRMMAKCMNSFKLLTDRCGQLEKANKTIMEELDRMRKKQQKEFIEVKLAIREVQTEGKQLTKKDSHKTSQVMQENIKTTLKEGLQQTLMEHLEKQLKLIRTTSQTKANTEATMEQQIETLRRQVNNIKINKLDVNEFSSVREFMKEDSATLTAVKERIEEVKQELVVMQQQPSVDYEPKMAEISDGLRKEIQALNNRLRTKSDMSDLLKLEELLVGMIEHAANSSAKRSADKLETKKGLVFLEKRINKVVMSMFGDEETDKDALFATKGWKCISCTKDLKDYQGRLDKFKPWAVFPAKEPPTKDKYTGFGQGFQTVVEKAVEKKGVEPTYDTYGRMTTPYNLSREVNVGSNKASNTPPTHRGLSSSHSTQLKNNNNANTTRSPGLNNSYLQTNFMNHFGSSGDPHINLREQYRNRFIGIEQYLKVSRACD